MVAAAVSAPQTAGGARANHSGRCPVQRNQARRAGTGQAQEERWFNQKMTALGAYQFSSDDLSAGSMRHEQVRLRRLKILDSSTHMRELATFVKDLRKERPSAYVPDFDPASGGVHARVLFLLEKPGPKTDATKGGSGFISPCNNDPTARAMHAFMAQRGLPICCCLHWNVIPWWDNKIEFDGKQQLDGLEPLREFMGMLQMLQAIVLVGKTAQRSWQRAKIAWPIDQIHCSPHPGPRVRAAYPELWNSIPNKWPSHADVDCI